MTTMKTNRNLFIASLMGFLIVAATLGILIYPMFQPSADNQVAGRAVDQVASTGAMGTTDGDSTVQSYEAQPANMTDGDQAGDTTIDPGKTYSDQGRESVYKDTAQSWSAQGLTIVRNGITYDCTQNTGQLDCYPR